MRETRLSGSEGGAAQTNVPSLPLYKNVPSHFPEMVLIFPSNSENYGYPSA